MIDEMPNGDDAVYVVRACRRDRTGHGGFQYPARGYVQCHDDWRPGDVLTGSLGLWGFEHGAGDYDVSFRIYPKPYWVVMVVHRAEVVPEKIHSSCRVPRGWVVHFGTFEDVVSELDCGTTYTREVAANMRAGVAKVPDARFKLDNAAGAARGIVHRSATTPTRDGSLDIFEPWRTEPSGEGFAWMTRFADFDRTGWSGFQYPEAGYVEAETWDPGVLPGEDRHVAARQPMGLWGYLDGAGDYRAGLRMYPDGVFQLLIVSRAELRGGLQRSVVAPRVWVKLTGGVSDICRHLRGIGDDYSARVADNVLQEFGKAVKWKPALRDFKELFTVGNTVIDTVADFHVPLRIAVDA